MKPEHNCLFATKSCIRRNVDIEVQTVLALLQGGAIWIIDEPLSQFLGPTRASKLLDTRRLNRLSVQRRGPWRYYLRWAESVWW